MKKNNILIATFAVITAAGSMAMANEIKLDFDRSGTHGSLTELIAKIHEADYTGKSDSPEPVAAAEEIASENNPYQDKLVLAKDLLRDITPEMRVDFVSTIHFGGNGVGPEGRFILAHSGLPETRISGIASALQVAPDKKYAGASSPKALSILLQGVPTDVKKDFVDNLKFLNGNVVSAKTDVLKNSVTQERSEEIISAIMPLSKDINGIRAILQDHACWASTGAKGRAVLRGCSYDPGYTCDEAKCK